MAQQPGETDWIFDAIVDYLKSPKWRTPMLAFVEESCMVFNAEEENKFEYTKIHNEFKELFEKLFAEMIKELGISEEMFVKACEEAYERPESRPLVEQMLAVDDFVSFKNQMVKRNRELNEQALKLLLSAGKRKEEKVPEAENAKLEEEELAAAIKESLKLEERRKEQEMEEDKQLQEAIKRSVEEQEKAATPAPKLTTKKELPPLKKAPIKRPPPEPVKSEVKEPTPAPAEASSQSEPARIIPTFITKDMIKEKKKQIVKAEKEALSSEMKKAFPEAKIEEAKAVDIKASPMDEAKKKKIADAIKAVIKNTQEEQGKLEKLKGVAGKKA